MVGLLNQLRWGPSLETLVSHNSTQAYRVKFTFDVAFYPWTFVSRGHVCLQYAYKGVFLSIVPLLIGPGRGWVPWSGPFAEV